MSDSIDQLLTAIKNQFSPNNSYDSDVNSCPVEPKRYHHFGVVFKVAQYKSDMLDSAIDVKIPVLPNDLSANARAEDADSAHNDSDYNKLQPAIKPLPDAHLGLSIDDSTLIFKHYYTQGNPETPDAFNAYLTCSTRLVVENNYANGYSKESPQSYVNDYFGQTLGLHIRRNQTYKVIKGGTFDPAVSIQQVNDLAATEKMVAQVYVYLKAIFDGQLQYYKVDNGQLADPISENDYQRLKKLTIDRQVEAYSGNIKIIPGVQQFHILISSGLEGSFDLEEVYCDGDKIYPEP